jgi:hypothetical protein
MIISLGEQNTCNIESSDRKTRLQEKEQLPIWDNILPILNNLIRIIHISHVHAI